MKNTTCKTESATRLASLETVVHNSYTVLVKMIGFYLLLAACLGPELKQSSTNGFREGWILLEELHHAVGQLCVVQWQALDLVQWDQDFDQKLFVFNFQGQRKAIDDAATIHKKINCIFNDWRVFSITGSTINHDRLALLLKIFSENRWAKIWVQRVDFFNIWKGFLCWQISPKVGAVPSSKSVERKLRRYISRHSYSFPLYIPWPML